MKRFIKKCLLTILMAFSIITLLFIGIVEGMGAGFSDTYQSVIVRKYNTLLTTNEPKIIIVAGSSAGFGIDEELIENITGYKVVNLGLHAGFGMDFPTQLTKANINKGDIIILAYEHDWIKENAFDTFGVDLVMSGIDNHLKMYKYIRPQHYDDILDYLFKFASKKAKRITQQEKASGSVYTAASFNNNGEMEFNRPTNIIQDDYDRKIYSEVNINGFSICKETKKYLMNYKKYVEDKGAILFFSAPPLMKSANVSSELEYNRLLAVVEDEIGIKYISKPSDYLFEAKHMYDTIYHLNNEGEKIRSKMLAEDINNAIKNRK